jgi:hypothetical protein
METVIKTLADILPLTEESTVRLERLKGIRDEDIDTSDMPELTADQLARGIRGRLRTPHVWSERGVAANAHS